jgi:hypothetical protein
VAKTAFGTTRASETAMLRLAEKRRFMLHSFESA